ncbi:hypothetical protein ACLKA7_002373 [Drosophila subpalustris]
MLVILMIFHARSSSVLQPIPIADDDCQGPISGATRCFYYGATTGAEDGAWINESRSGRRLEKRLRD